MHAIHRFGVPLPVIVAALAGCAAPLPVVRLYPNSPDVVWVSGRATVAKEEAGVRVATAFEHQDGDNLELRVEIQNLTEAPFVVTPEEFTFTTCATEGVSSCALTRRITNPESVLAVLEEKQSRDRADATNSQPALGTLVILSAVTDVATVASGRADSTTGRNTAASADLALADAAQSDSTMASTSVQQQMWSNVALRRNTVYPGHAIAGEVFFPFDPKARMVWLHVRTGGRVLSFPFKQVLTPVPRYEEPRGPHHQWAGTG